MYEASAGCAGFASQKFQSKSSEWTKLNTAYTAEAIKNAPVNFTNFLDYMKDANDAIRSAGIDGIETITEGPSSTDTVTFKVKNTRLGFFTEKIHGETETYVDDPFVTKMDELKKALESTYQISIVSEDGTYTLDYMTSTPENIREFFEGLLGQYDVDSHLFTGDENVDKYVRDFSRFDSSEHMYVYEVMLEDWAYLNADEKEALRHYYEYNFRVMEMSMDPNSAEAWAARQKVNAMQKYFYGVTDWEADFYVTDTGKEMLSLMNKNSSHSYEILTSINDFHGQNVSVTYDDGTGLPLGSNFNQKLTLDYDKAGLNLTITVSNSTLELSNVYKVGYYTSEARSLSYVQYQEKNNPGCYDHQKDLGLNTRLLADLLTAAESSKDMEILDNLTKGHGQNYREIFTGDPSDMTVSGASAVVLYNQILSQRYYNFGDEECRAEAARMNDFLMRGKEEYSSEYYNMYNLAMYQMVYGDAEVEPKTSIGEAIARGFESEFIVWPTAIYSLLESINEDNVTRVSDSDLAKLTTLNGDMNDDQFGYMFALHSNEFSMQDRLDYYQTCVNYDWNLDGAELDDLRNIYFSYADYVLEKQINLTVTQQDQDMLSQLFNLMTAADRTFRKNNSYAAENAKIDKAQADHPIAFGVGKVGADVVIYTVFNATGGGFIAAGAEGFAANVFRGTVADLIIKDLPKAINSYAHGEDIGTVVLDLGKDLVIDTVTNGVTEAASDVVKSGADALSAKKGAALADDFKYAPDQTAFLKNLSQKDLALMTSQMDYGTAAQVLSRYSDDVARDVIGQMDIGNAAKVLSNMDTDSVIKTINHMPESDVVKLVESMDPAAAGRAMNELQVDTRARVFSNLDVNTKADILGTVDTSEANAILKTMDSAQQAVILSNMDSSAVDAVTSARYGEVSNYAEFADNTRIIAMRSDLNTEAKIKELQKLFDESGYKADINVPGNSQYVVEIKPTGEVVYSWPDKFGLDESQGIVSVSPKDPLPATWDRYGYMGGTNFADVPAGGKYTYSQRSIPYLENEAAYHSGTFNSASYFSKIDAIRNGDLDALNAILRNEGIDELDRATFDNISDNYIRNLDDIISKVGDGVDASYGVKGKAASWGDLEGGAGQYVMPLNGYDLEKIGVLKECEIMKPNSGPFESFQAATATPLQKSNFGEHTTDVEVLGSQEIKDHGLDLKNEGPKPPASLDVSQHHGIDHLYINLNESSNVKAVIVETKYGTADLDRLTSGDRQMSYNWLFGEGDIQSSRVYKALKDGGMSKTDCLSTANMIKEALDDGQVNLVLAHVDPDGTVTFRQLILDGLSNVKKGSKWP